MYIALNKTHLNGKECYSVLDTDDLSIDVIDRESIQNFISETHSRIRWFPTYCSKDYGSYVVLYPKNGAGTIYVQTQSEMMELCRVPDEFSFSVNAMNGVLEIKITFSVLGNKIVKIFSVSQDSILDSSLWRLNNG